MPVAYGSTTVRAAVAATAASAAVPPSASTSMPTWLATGSTDATAPPEPVMVAVWGSRWLAGPSWSRAGAGLVGEAVASAGVRTSGTAATRAATVRRVMAGA